jgi:hypothetical protein
MNISCRCEHEFWRTDPHASNSIDEPIAAISGLLMILIPLLDSGGLAAPPLQLCIARASLVMCGFGTYVFHALSEQRMLDLHLNGIIFDGVSMALVTVNVFLLHLTDWMKQHLMGVSVGAMVYLFFWVISNDMMTFSYLESSMRVNGTGLFSMAIQYPTFILVYVYILGKVLLEDGLLYHWPMWVCLCISLAAWCLNQFACAAWSGVFVGHTIWHLGIGYVVHYLAVLGAARTYGYTLRDKGVLFLKLEKDTSRDAKNVCVRQGKDARVGLDTGRLFEKV